MTGQQSDAIKEYENEMNKRGRNGVLDWKESNSAESRGVLFADVDGGVTLMIYSDGLINIPAVRSWNEKKYYHVTQRSAQRSYGRNRRHRMTVTAIRRSSTLPGILIR